VVRRALLIVPATILLIAAADLSGQQPNRRPEPYVAPLLPGEQAWLVTLPAVPAAGGAMDTEHVYVPLQDVATMVEGERIVKPASAAVVAVARETGATRWSAPVESVVAPVVDAGRLFVAGTAEIHVLDAATGMTLWMLPLEARVRGPLLVRGNVLVALTEPDQLTALRIDTREIAWRAAVGAGQVLMNANEQAVYVTTPDSRLVCLRLADGSVLWERRLAGTLGPPALGWDRVVVGSTTNSLWAFDPQSGDEEWVWVRPFFGGNVLGADVDEDFVYVVSLDNVLRALNRGNGHQEWKIELPTRPVYPPQAFFGTVAVTGLARTVSTFLAKNGMAAGSWAPPPPGDAEMQGPPLIDQHLKPFGVAMAVIFRDGRVVGVRPTAMTFPEPAAAPLKFMPGRTLPPEPLPGETPPPVAPTPAR
jgi:outer membrane protein assembly factor BamB